MNGLKKVTLCLASTLGVLAPSIGHGQTGILPVLCDDTADAWFSTPAARHDSRLHVRHKEKKDRMDCSRCEEFQSHSSDERIFDAQANQASSSSFFSRTPFVHTYR